MADAANRDSQGRPTAGETIAVVGTVLLVHGLWLALGATPVLSGGLADPDSYARLVRVANLHDTGAWFDTGLPRANAPFGGSLHWTRPLDVILLALAGLLAPFSDFHSALFGAAAAVGPLLHLTTALTLAWAVMPVTGRGAAVLAGVLAGLQGGLLAYATAGHADHHILFALIAAWAVGLTLRLLTMAEPGGRRPAVLGLALAFGLWVGPEALVLAALCLGATALPWLFGRPGWAAVNRRATLALAAGVGLALLIERGPTGLAVVSYDRISVVDLTLAVLLAAFWFAAGRAGGAALAGRMSTRRLGLGVGGLLIVAAVLRALFPDILRGPLAGVDPALLPLLADIREFAGGGDPRRFLIYLGGALFAVPWGVWRLGRAWPDERLRWPWALLAGGLALYLGLALVWVRHAIYADLFIAAVLADLVVHLDRAVTDRLAGWRRVVVKVPALAAVMIGPLALAVALDRAAPGAAGTAPPGADACDIKGLARVLDAPPWNDRRRVILASANHGPELLYRTPHAVTATLHHRNAAGILFNVEVLGGHDEAAARARLDTRRVDLILVCPAGDGGLYTRGDPGPDVLYRRLAAGRPPDWLAPVTLPPALAAGMRLYRVIGRK